MSDKAKSEVKKTMDVSKPGKTAPDNSSRPVIISHRPIVQDPMVKTDVPSAVEASVVVEEKPVSHGEKIIQPITALATEPSPTPEPDAKTEQSEPAVQDASKDSETEKIDSPPPEPSSTEDDNSEAVVEAVAGQADIVSKKKQTELTEADKAKQEALQKLIVDKKYFLPIGQQQHRRNTRTALVGILFIILLAVGGLYALIDAGLISVPFELPINLINN